MNQRATFGIVGAYGAAGRAVVSEILKFSDARLLVAGRDQAKLDSFAAEYGNRVSSSQLDILHSRSLDEFCTRCAIIVNCGGPVTLLQDRVAQAAFHAHCHYLDLAGMSLIKERLLPHNQKIEDLGLAFVVSAGWTPGITELLPLYAHTRARSKMDSIESVSVYFSDSGEWSANALRDGVAHLREVGISKPGYFRKGAWVRAKTSEASLKVDLGDPIGRRRFSLFSMPELNEVGRQLTDCNFLPYSYLSSFQNAIAAITIALLPLSEDSGVRLLRNIFRRNKLPVAGFVAVHVTGHSAGRAVTLKTRIQFETGFDYWMNGTVLATAARLVASGKVNTGVHYLFDAVDPMTFMDELRKAGVQETVTGIM